MAETLDTMPHTVPGRRPRDYDTNGNPIAHGTTRGYFSQACNCDECKIAMRAAGREQTARKRAKREALAIAAERGELPTTASGFDPPRQPQARRINELCADALELDAPDVFEWVLQQVLATNNPTRRAVHDLAAAVIQDETPDIYDDITAQARWERQRTEADQPSRVDVLELVTLAYEIGGVQRVMAELDIDTDRAYRLIRTARQTGYLDLLPKRPEFTELPHTNGQTTLALNPAPSRTPEYTAARVASRKRLAAMGNDEVMATVANAYNDGGRQAVMDALGTSISHTGKLITRARKAGLLNDRPQRPPRTGPRTARNRPSPAQADQPYLEMVANAYRQGGRTAVMNATGASRTAAFEYIKRAREVGLITAGGNQ